MAAAVFMLKEQGRTMKTLKELKWLSQLLKEPNIGRHHRQLQLFHRMFINPTQHTQETSGALLITINTAMIMSQNIDQ